MPWENEVEEKGHSSETRVEIIILAFGDMKFVHLVICDKDGVPRNTFAESEKVWFLWKIVNQGSAGAKDAKIEIYDDDTGDWVSTMPVAGIFPPGKWSEGKSSIAYMPARDWTLRFELTP